MATRIDILTLFPAMMRAVLSEGMPRIATEKGVVVFHLTNFRDFAEGFHQAVDDRPYGGGPGMVLKPEPIFRAVREVLAQGREEGREDPTMILLTPQGRRFDQRRAEALAEAAAGAGERSAEGVAEGVAEGGWLILLCGRYEGFDERIRLGFPWLEVSIGDYVLSGGEPAAFVVVDALIRLLPGVLGHEAGADEESFGPGLGGSLLEYPQYTRPVEFEGVRVPEVLLSGNHAEIAKWRREQARKRTRERRPDLLSPGRSAGETA